MIKSDRLDESIKQELKKRKMVKKGRTKDKKDRSKNIYEVFKYQIQKYAVSEKNKIRQVIVLLFIIKISINKS